MKIIDGGKAQRLLKARELIFQFGITGDERYLDQVREMARQDSRRTSLKLVNNSVDDQQAQKLRTEP